MDFPMRLVGLLIHSLLKDYWHGIIKFFFFDVWTPSTGIREKPLNYGFRSYENTKEVMINMKGTKIVIKLILYKENFMKKEFFCPEISYFVILAVFGQKANEWHSVATNYESKACYGDISTFCDL